MNSDNPFERYINGEIGEDQLKHIVKTVDQGDPASDATVELHVAKYGSQLFITNVDEARKRLQQLDPEMKAAIDRKMQEVARSMLAQAFGISGPLSREFGGPSLTADALVEIRDRLRNDFRERMLSAYGEAFVAEADEFARTSGASFETACQSLLMREAVAKSAEALRQLFERVETFLQSDNVRNALNQLGEAAHDVLNDQPAATNRHTRRAAKHSKPMKDGDQVWNTNRSSRNRRNR